jgi:lipoprotein NlpD
MMRIMMNRSNNVPSKLLRLGVGFMLVMGLLELAACSSRPIARAPVEERGDSKMVQPVPVDSKPLPGLNALNAGKPGYYTVKPGDNLTQISRISNQNWRDIVRWNNLESPNLIEVGQVLRITAPEGSAIATPVNPGAGAASTSKPLPAASVPALVTPATPAAMENDIAWIWPSNGALIAGFDEVKNKGLKIAGKLGDPVVASADGRVVYAGSGLRGYGNLVILKHNETYLTAYAHNQTLLVKEDQTVRKGQRIADMGSSDADKVMLHFEVRRQGKPVDPAKYLPPR